MKEQAFEVLLNRRAIRRFKPEQVSDELLDAVLEAGTFAPTGCGFQSPVIIAVQKPEELAKVKALNAKVMGSNGDPYYGAPTVLLILFTEKAPSEEIGILDCGAVCTNLLNAAYAAGLGSCWIHRCKEMFESDEGKALLASWGIIDKLRGAASIALGYADCEHPVPRPRKENYIIKI